MVKHITLQALLIFMLFISCCLNALSNDLHVVTESWPPFNYKNEQGNIVGSSTDNVNEILALSALDYDITLYPWARTYKLAQSKKNHLIYAIYKTAEREKYFHWFCPIAPRIKLYFIKLATSPIELSTFSQAKTHKIGVVRKDAPNVYLISEGFIPGVNLYEANNENSNIQQLLSGTVDFIVQSKASIDYRLALMKLPKNIITLSLELPIASNDVCMALNINSDVNILRKVTKGFNEWQKQGH